MPNVHDDDVETLWFAEEGDDYEESEPRVAVGELIADWFGRSPIEADYELADQIIGYLRQS